MNYSVGFFVLLVGALATPLYLTEPVSSRATIALYTQVLLACVMGVMIPTEPAVTLTACIGVSGVHIAYALNRLLSWGFTKAGVYYEIKRLRAQE